MKKLIFTSLLCALVLTSCGSGSTDSSSKSESPTDTTSVDSTASVESIEPSSEETTATTVGEGDIDDYHVKITSATMGVDYKGESAIIITYDFTNNSDSEQAFIYAVSADVYQNGIECGSATMVDGVDVQKQMNKIKPGTTYQIEIAYELQDETSPVEVECKEAISFGNDSEVVSQTFTLPLE